MQSLSKLPKPSKPHLSSQVTMLEKTKIIKSGVDGNPRNRLLIVTATLGLIRIEWAMSRYGQPTPCNWSAGGRSLGIGCTVPLHFLVADAQNFGCEDVVNQDYEWMLLWEDDVIAPPDAFLQLNEYMKKGTVPVVSGLYYLKSNYTEPILYRGLGTGAYEDFKVGDKVWADGVPTGFLLIHNSIIKLMWNESEEYETVGGRKTRKVFETPAKCYYDRDTNSFASGSGTSDLNWCNRVIKEDVLKRAGWPKIGRKKYPFLCDTNIFCKHIDLSTGKQYP